MFHAFNCRSKMRSIFDLGLFTNRAIWGAFGVGVVLQALAIYVPALNPVFKTEPLGVTDLVVVFGLSLVMLVGGELLKVWARRRYGSGTGMSSASRTSG
jgi:Ca2+-transporting ATPase